MRNAILSLALAGALTSCGTVIPVPDSMFSENPRHRMAVRTPGQPAPDSPGAGGSMGRSERVEPPPPQRRSQQPARPPLGARVPGKPGFLFSPYVRGKLVDARDLPRGIVIPDPYTGAPITVP